MTEIKNEIKKTEKPKANLRFKRDKDREMVKGIFRFYEVPGGTLSFNIRVYKEDPVETFHLVDGQVYTIPLGVAKHLNTSGAYPQYEYFKEDGSGATANLTGGLYGQGQAMRVSKKVRRYGFQSLEFVDVEELGQSAEESKVALVEKV